MSKAGHSVTLPDGFAALEPFTARWALASEQARNAERLASSLADIRRFYDAMLPHMEALGAHLAKFRLGELPDPEQNLYHLALSLMEVAPAVEIHGAPDVPDAIEAHRFAIESP